VAYTHEQWEATQHVRDHLSSPESASGESTNNKEQDADLTNALMCFCMLVVMQDTSRVRLYDSPLEYYLAVHGVDEKHQTLRAIYFCTLTLTSALWINRLTMLEVGRKWDWRARPKGDAYATGSANCVGGICVRDHFRPRPAF
jgi:hypothetical protein